MSKLVGNVRCELQVGYPKLTLQAAAPSIQVAYMVNLAWLQTEFPQCGDGFRILDLKSSAAYAFFAQYDMLTLHNCVLTPKAGGELYYLELSYELRDGDWTGNDSVIKTELEYETQDEHLALNRLTNYRTNWDHQLCANGGGAIPSWYYTANDTTIPGADRAAYVWVKAGDAPPAGFAVIAAETMPGVEAKLTGVTVVHVVQRSTSKRKLQASAAADYTRQQPPDTFGKDGDWLRGGSRINKSGKYWELRVDYRHAALGIDERLGYG